MKFVGLSFGRGTAALVLASLALAACSGVRDQLGLNKAPPDEFTVVRKAPLALPPNFNLRPPTPGAPDDRAPAATEVARRALSGDNARRQTAATSTGEKALLRQAGTSQAEPDIRRVLLAETTQLSEKDKTLVDRLIFWRDPNAEDEDIIDAAAESRRLREASLNSDNTDLGGDAPTIRRRGRSLLGGFF
jgi:hypothetical protein